MTEFCTICGTRHDMTTARCGGTPTFQRPDIDSIAQAVAAERARCAKVARDAQLSSTAPDVVLHKIYNLACEEIAAAIERGKT